ncbi:MAG TPA: Stp1/IreP family PP2C-type Ser/Thr phosphatase [Pseudomonadales bacterium]|nr:Stp1/IreP family PP2C-type Ser/Thr phosphatase [Pseudomonadales bacterium]
MNLKGRVEFVAQTDVGQVRDHNEDYISCEGTLGVAVLADGMGGLNAGEVASSMSVRMLMDELTAWRGGESEVELSDVDTTGLTVEGRAVKHFIEKTNGAVYHVSQTQPQCRGMGTTVVVSVFHDNKLAVGHIGDSRMYRFRDDTLEQITKDHSFVQELIDQGVVTKEEARRSNRKNVVTRALGVSPAVDAEVKEYKVKPGDIYLMCSDGLSDLVADEDIEAALQASGGNLAETASHLVDMANAGGGKDNISVVLARVLKPFPADNGIINKLTNWF